MPHKSITKHIVKRYDLPSMVGCLSTLVADLSGAPLLVLLYDLEAAVETLSLLPTEEGAFVSVSSDLLLAVVHLLPPVGNGDTRKSSATISDKELAREELISSFFLRLVTGLRRDYDKE